MSNTATLTSGELTLATSVNFLEESHGYVLYKEEESKRASQCCRITSSWLLGVPLGKKM